MISLIQADGRAERAQIALMRGRAQAANREIDAAVASIMQDVKEYGFSAVSSYALRFDGAEPCELTSRALDDAYAACSPAVIDALERAARNISDYNRALITRSAEWKSPDGGTVGRVVRGLGRVGIYVPGGTAAYPSSVLMCAVPAKAAGVGEIVMVTPPTENLNSAVLAAAKIAGVDRVISVGGAQAVAALTFGAGFIPRVDKLVGPGNAYVASAKRLAYGTVDIDMIAGPSEVLIIADQTAKAEFIAADLLSQAEHDRMASAVLLTTSAALAGDVKRELSRQAALLPRSEIIAASLRDFGCIIVCGSLDEAMALANDIAPEHLEIMTEDPRALLPAVENAGAVFLGPWSPEPLGDYMAGPSHVLPTAGTARFFSPLSAESFLKSISVIAYDRASLAAVSSDVIALARCEHLDAHANAVNLRFAREEAF